MRRHLLFLVLAVILPAVIAAPALSDPGHAGDGHGGFTTDDPAGDDAALGFDGAGYSSVEASLGEQPSATRSERRARNVSLVGSLRLDPFNAGVHGDVAGFKDLAFVGKWRELCPGTGVDIIDISDPASPIKIADTLDANDTSMEDMEAMTIGERDVLAIGLQDCGNIAGVGKSGLELYDITDPDNPAPLSFFNVDQFGVDITGVHELDLTVTPDGRILALLAVPNLEANTFNPSGNSFGDLLILDISDPANPVLTGEWGVLDDPDPFLGVNFYLSVRQGGDARTLDHSARANRNGTRAYLSYWDAGFITLDIRDPSNPVFLGFAPKSSPSDSYAAGEEGNAHSVAEVQGGRILIGADEDFSPFEFQFTSNAFEGTRPAVEAAFTPQIVDQPGREMAGEVVHVGRACPADPSTGLVEDDPFLADPTGKIALIERGLCRFDNKVARAQQEGAIGVIVYNNAAGGEGLVLMGGDNPVQQGGPGVVGTEITIPAVFVQRSTGLLLRDGTPPVTARAAAVFNGWGFLRFFDITDPANPVQLSTFATANTFNDAVATEGTWSVHNPEVVGTTVYASWYNDGVRVIDISQVSSPREIGFWTGAGAPSDAPAVNIWSVVPHNGLLLASDRNFGLYVLKAAP